MGRRALICGVSGQDGAYLAAHLLDRGYEVIGTTRGPAGRVPERLSALAIADRVSLVTLDPLDFGAVRTMLAELAPDEVYNLSAQSSVGLSFAEPLATMHSIVTATANLLEAVRTAAPGARVYVAGSGECFGNTGTHGADEQTSFAPRSPYAFAKAAAQQLVESYRDNYQIYVCTGITFNHESPLRSAQFVTRKITSAAALIAARRQDVLRLGPVDVVRDWGWAPEYVDAMARMLQRPAPADYVLATGRAERLDYFVAKAFDFFGLDWRRHVVIDEALRRPSEIAHSRGNPARAQRELGWTAISDVDTVVTRMCEAEEIELGTQFTGRLR